MPIHRSIAILENQILPDFYIRYYEIEYLVYLPGKMEKNYESLVKHIINITLRVPFSVSFIKLLYYPTIYRAPYFSTLWTGLFSSIIISCTVLCKVQEFDINSLPNVHKIYISLNITQTII